MTSILPRQARAFVIRSVHAHARIKAIDATRAKVCGRARGAHRRGLQGRRRKPISPDPSLSAPVEAQRAFRTWFSLTATGRWFRHLLPLAVGKVHYVGEAVVLVVAETLAIAKDACELVEIDYEALTAVVDTALAAEADARGCAILSARM